MKTRLLLLLGLWAALSSCDFRKSVHKDLLTGLTTTGNGLSCEEVYLSDGQQKISRNAFVYGEKIYVTFENAEGFATEGGYAFPGMGLYVVSQAGDTLLQNSDLYAGQTGGMNFSPLQLRTNLTVADPIHSGGSYTLFIEIWDKKEKGTFRAKMDFTVVPSEHMEIEAAGVAWDEMYLFLPEKGITLTGNRVGYDEDIYLILEGLEGFTVEEGQVFATMRMKITDAAGQLILEEPDLLEGKSTDYESFHSQLTSRFRFSGSVQANPVACEVVIRDAKGEGFVKATARLMVGN